MNQVHLTKIIARAIAGRNLLRVVYRDGARMLMPHLIYATKAGDLILHGWQVSGTYSVTPPPDWCNLRVAEISSVTLLAKKFTRPRPDYNPGSSQFHKVIFQLPPAKTAASRTEGAMAASQPD